VIFLRLWWRSRRAPAYRYRWGERFARYPFSVSPFGDEQPIWIHAVSVGETIAAKPFIEALLVRYPHILITTMTPTGSEQAAKLFCGRVAHVYLPYDYGFAVRHFLKLFNPRVGILMETELWPNLIAHCQRHAIPLIVANARLSASSAQGYRYLGGLTRGMLQNLRLIVAQHEDDARRFIELGAPEDKVKISGSLKFDLSIAADLPQQANSLRDSWGQRPVWIAASTHEGEDTQILHAFAQLHIADALLILVPRHPERFCAVEKICEQQGYQVALRSLQDKVTPETHIYLGDTMGELMLLYACADVAFVGGSLVASGGHNPLEPAALSVPVIFGPHMFNFADISRRLVAANAAWQVDNADALAWQVRQCLRDEALRREAGQRAQQFVAANQGALQRLMHWVTPYL
jgi:3-deoxy-D-manno-octulosonic-acid transferase